MKDKLQLAQAERNRLGCMFFRSKAHSAAERALIYAYNKAHKKCRRLGETGKFPRMINPKTCGKCTIDMVSSSGWIDEEWKEYVSEIRA